MNEKLISQALRLLCMEYEKENGRSLSALQSYKFGYYIFTKLSEDSELAINISEDGELMGRIVDELEARGLVAQVNENFVLTPKGLKAGTSSRITKLIDWFNLNPGASTIIAIVALIVSIISLVISAQKP